MNSYLIQLIERFVEAYEREQVRKDEEWKMVKDEAERRTAAMEKLAGLSQEMGIDVSKMEVVDLNDFLEDDDEDRGD